MIALVSTVLWTVLMTMILTILSNLTISVDRTLSTFGISKQTTILTAKHRTAPVRFSEFIYSFKAMNSLLSQFRCLSFNRNYVFIVLQKYRMEITLKLDFLPHTKTFPVTPRLCIAKPRQRFRKPFSTAWKTLTALHQELVPWTKQVLLDVTGGQNDLRHQAVRDFNCLSHVTQTYVSSILKLFTTRSFW